MMLLVLVLVLVPLGQVCNLLVLGWLTTLLILGVALWDTHAAKRRQRLGTVAEHGHH
ncbi:hypothetical protein WH367_00555 [Comamonas sp. MYb21]|uniref:hypothetical protein n=1 Tax=Comamonas sp. MYb21 TaxID=1848648 RepID=UPI00309C1677